MDIGFQDRPSLRRIIQFLLRQCFRAARVHSV